jgi:hypothetical protein
MPSTLLERIRGALAGAQPRDAGPDLAALEQRVAHLEALVEGLQDAFHRESVRHDERVMELQRKIEPEAMAKSLSEDARRRGL